MEDIITGKEFKNMVRGAGLTVAGVCKKAAVRQSTISLWCNNAAAIRDDKLRKLVRAFNELTGARC